MIRLNRIEPTKDIIQVIEGCYRGIVGDEISNNCELHCPLFGVCLEYWTGDASENQDYKMEDIPDKF